MKRKVVEASGSNPPISLKYASDDEISNEESKLSSSDVEEVGIIDFYAKHFSPSTLILIFSMFPNRTSTQLSNF